MKHQHSHTHSHDHSHHHEHHHGSARSMPIAFLLNLSFSVFELIGGLLTGSVAILSDAIHDLGDAAGIGCAVLLERKSRKPPDEAHTYGYVRYSVLGGLITTLILLAGSALVIGHAALRLLSPTPIRYDGMILLAVIGAAVNMAAALLTRHGDSLNQKAVNLHMLEDVLGWLTVLAGAIIMRFTDWVFLDPLMSIGVAVFILLSALGNLKEVADLFLERTPRGVDVSALRLRLAEVDGVVEVHHLHLRSLDGRRHDATLHAVLDGDPVEIKAALRRELAEHSILHATIETEAVGEACAEMTCRGAAPPDEVCGHHHHHLRK